MSSGFAPSINNASAQGVRVIRQDYPAGPAGVQLSLEQIALRIREGQADASVSGVAFDVLLKAGFRGRSSKAGTAKQRAQALLDFVREVTLYAPDPPNMELNKSAAAMLCLRPGLCIRGGDCDDQLVLLGSLVGAVGIPVYILKQTFPVDPITGEPAQEHVLLEAQDENGDWFPLDPSSDYPAGRRASAAYELRVDPWNPGAIPGAVAAEPLAAQFVGIGSIPFGRRTMTTTQRIGVSKMRFIAMAPLQMAAIGLGAGSTSQLQRHVGVGGTRIIYPSDVVNRKNAIEVKMASINTDVAACTKLPAATKAGWADFHTAWRKFYCNDSTGACSAPDYSIWSLGAQMDDCETWDGNVFAWQKTLSTSCTLSIPIVAPPATTGSTPNVSDQVAAVLKAVTGVVVAGTVAFAIVEAVKWLDLVRPAAKRK